MAMLASARKQGFSGPVLTNSSGGAKWTQGDPFDNVQSGYYYWSSDALSFGSANAWTVDMLTGTVKYFIKVNFYYVWPVRAGQ